MAGKPAAALTDLMPGAIAAKLNNAGGMSLLFSSFLTFFQAALIFSAPQVDTTTIACFGPS